MHSITRSPVRALHRHLVVTLLTAVAALALRPAVAAGTIHYVYVVPMSHLAIGFTNAVPDLMGIEKQYLEDAMDYADQYPDYRWTVESVWQLDQWLNQTTDAAQIDRMRALIGQGRIEVMAGYANMHQGVLGF